MKEWEHKRKRQNNDDSVVWNKPLHQTSSYTTPKLRWQMRFSLTNLSLIFNLSFHLNVKLTFSPTGFLIFPLSRNFTFKPILPTPKWMLAARKHRVKFAFKFKCYSDGTRALGLFKPWNIFSVRLRCYCIERMYWNVEKWNENFKNYTSVSKELSRNNWYLHKFFFHE